MPFRALVSSPLGPVLLESDEAGLTGLYFTDQRDLPQAPGVQAAEAVVSDPTAGVRGGRALRGFKVVRKPPAGESGELFADGGGLAAAGAGQWGDAGVLSAAGGLSAAGAGQQSDAGASSVAGAGQRGDADRSGADAAAPLRLLQEDTPAGALAVLEQARRELDEYWRGERRVFQVPLAPRGTAFQQKVWRALLDVPWGETLSYGELALAAGMGAGHGRAVGTAVGSNPISIIIPCHRILAGNGTLNGYGGGLERKVRLLEIEGFALR